jgi:polyferredoxin
MFIWLLDFLPEWFFYVPFFLSLFGLVLSIFAPMHKTLMQVVCVVVLLFSVYMFGGIAENKKWKERVTELEAKVVVAENKSAIETVKVVEKVVYQKQIIKQKGAEVIKYIDKEVVKYDTKFLPGEACELPVEFIESLNKAAE